MTIIEASTSVIRESRLFEGRFEDVFQLEAEIARGVAVSLAASTTPAFERRIRATQKLNPEIVALYYEASTLRDPPSDPVRSRLAEAAYRRVIELDPEFAGGYAGLVYVLAFRSWWRVGQQPEVDAQLALEAARLAVEKDPESGWAHATLGIALNVIGDHEGALRAARRGGELAPNDPYALAFSAVVQTFEGEAEAAVPLARSAIRLDPLSVRTPFRNILGVVLFQTGEYSDSLDVMRENLALGGPDGPHMVYLRAGSLAALGRVEEARLELEKVAAFPYEFDMRDFLSAFRDPRDSRKLWDRLESVGLDTEATAVSRAP